MSRKVLLIGVGVIVLFALGWMFLLYRPAGTELDDARIELDQVNVEVINLENQVARLRSIEADLPRLQSGIETLRAAVPDDPGLADFILAVNEAAIASGLEVQSIVPEIPRQGLGSGLGEINVGLNTEGGYYKILDFLNRVSAMHRVVTIEAIGLSAFREENVASEPVLQVSLQARIYVNPAGLVPEGVQDPAESAAGDGSEDGSDGSGEDS